MSILAFVLPELAGFKKYLTGRQGDKPGAAASESGIRRDKEMTPTDGLFLSKSQFLRKISW
ncbi:MAG: hypothetical protein IT259_13300 [Saprospiraceae bacterium]|nr:hypothetical protein [Saprospiraceae bacterium]